MASRDEDTKKPRRVFQGICNNMPTFDSNSRTDYVILGSHSTWIKDTSLLPVALELPDGQRKKVNKETYDWMCRELDLSSLSHEKASEFKIKALLELSDGTKEDVVINVETVC